VQTDVASSVPRRSSSAAPQERRREGHATPHRRSGGKGAAKREAGKLAAPSVKIKHSTIFFVFSSFLFSFFSIK
jgi:hypothetical protein